MTEKFMIKLNSYRALRQAMEQEIRGPGGEELTRLTAETYCITHDYSFELCNQLLDRYYENEFKLICNKRLNNRPYQHLIDQVLIDIESKLLIAAVEGKTYFK